MPLFGGPNIKKLKAKRDVPGLLHLVLHGEKLEHQRDARWALKDIGDSSVVPALIEALRSHDSSVRAAAALALGDFGDRTAVEPLLLALNDEDGSVRRWAAGSLGELQEERAIPPLVAILRSHQAVDRLEHYHVAKALGWIGTPDAAAALREALARENERPYPDRMVVDEIIFQLQNMVLRPSTPKTVYPRTVEALLVLSSTEVPGIQSLLQQIVDQQRDRGHDIAPRFKAVARVTSDPADMAYAYAAVRGEFPDFDPDGLADRTERFDFQGPGGTSGHYYIVFDRPRPDARVSSQG